jgi:hypothetical protein
MKPNRIDRLKIRIKRALGMKVILCDSCKWDWRSACRNPDRPNAIYCKDYQKRGT